MSGGPGHATVPVANADGDASGRIGAPPRLKVAYVMSRFPKLSETFVLNEILAVERLGVDVALYPLIRERADRLHPGAAALVERAHYLPFLSWPILQSQGYYLRHARGPTWVRYETSSEGRSVASTSSRVRSGSSPRSLTRPV